MPSTQPVIRDFNNPGPGIAGKNLHELLDNLGGPAWITLDGVDRSRRRVIVALLHANEPSGLHAIHHLLTSDQKPATDLGIVIAAVDAALEEPVLSHRYLPWEKDLNRCFAPPYTDDQGRLAEQIIERILDFRPEALVDCHNTSAHSQPFCVSSLNNPQTVRFAGMFADVLVHIDQHLGTLLNHLPEDILGVTVEFGSFLDPGADRLAESCIRSFVFSEELPLDRDAMLLSQPIRLETEHHLEVAYSASLVETADLTVINAIDQLNFKVVEPGTVLGWFKAHEHRNLVARRSDGTDSYAHYFTHEDGVLSTRMPLTIFMATTDPVVANNDCLLYFTESSVSR